MAQFAGGDSVVQIDNASDALQTVSGGIQSFTIDLEVQGGSYHTLANRWGKRQEGGIAGTVTINFYDDTTATEFAGYMREWLLDATAKGGARSMRIQTPDASTGSTQYDFEVRPGGSYQLANITAGSGDPHTLSLTLGIDGAVTDSTIS